MLFDNGIRRGQPKTASLLLCSKKGIEYPGNMVFRYSNTPVFQRNLHIFSFLQSDEIILSYENVFTLELDDTSLWHGLEAVNDKIVNYLSDLPFIRLNSLETLRDYKVAHYVRTPEGKLHRFSDYRCNRENCLHRRPALGKGQQLHCKVLRQDDRFFSL